MERISRGEFFRVSGKVFAGIFIGTTLGWHKLEHGEQDSMLLICARYGETVSIESSDPNNILVNGRRYPNMQFGVVYGNPETGESALASIGSHDEILELEAQNMIFYRWPLRRGIIYDPGEGVRAFMTSVRRSFLNSSGELKRILPPRCYRRLFANG